MGPQMEIIRIWSQDFILIEIYFPNPKKSPGPEGSPLVVRSSETNINISFLKMPVRLLDLYFRAFNVTSTVSITNTNSLVVMVSAALGHSPEIPFHKIGTKVCWFDERTQQSTSVGGHPPNVG